MKSVTIKFIFDNTEWNNFKKYYSDKELRQILFEGAIGELSLLVEQQENQNNPNWIPGQRNIT